MSNLLWPHGLQHVRPPCLSPTPGVYSNSCPLSWWCHPTISSFVIPFSSCLQSFPASGSFKWVSSSHQVPKVLEFQLHHQSFHEYSVLLNIQDWFPLGWTGWISLQSKEYIKAVYCHPAYLTYMQSTSWETLGWMKHQLESRLPGEIKAKVSLLSWWISWPISNVINSWHLMVKKYNGLNSRQWNIKQKLFFLWMSQNKIPPSYESL